MIERWVLNFFPSVQDEQRYKIKVKCEEKYVTDLIRKIGNICGRPSPIEGDDDYNWMFYIYKVDSATKQNVMDILEGKSALEEIPPAAPAFSAAIAPQPSIPHQPPNLNPAYTFENFVVGSSNRFTHAAAQAVAKKPGEVYNPLFIFGGVGLGKTHLMHAIGHYMYNVNPAIIVVYITTEKFIDEVINAISSGTIQDLRNKYRQVDALLVDDIQFLAEAESTQEDFFHTFNALYENHRQIVITSDKPPKQLPGLEDRLRSRFEWGLIADIKAPDVETRIAILKHKEEYKLLNLDDTILAYIANRLESNIRELEGFLKRIYAYSKLTNRAVDMIFVKEIMNDLLPEEERESVAEKEAGKVAVQEEPVKGAEKKAEDEKSRKERAMEELKKLSKPPVEEKVESKPAGTAEKAVPGEGEGAARDMEIAYFYPQGHEKENQIMKDYFNATAKKHKLKFRLGGVFDEEYVPVKKINYGMFAELCKTNKIRIAIVLGPASDAELSQEEFSQMLGPLLEDEGIELQFIPFADLKKEYKYLNLLLDMVLIEHKGIF